MLQTDVLSCYTRTVIYLSSYANIYVDICSYKYTCFTTINQEVIDVFGTGVVYGSECPSACKLPIGIIITIQVYTVTVMTHVIALNGGTI